MKIGAKYVHKLPEYALYRSEDDCSSLLPDKKNEVREERQMCWFLLSITMKNQIDDRFLIFKNPLQTFEFWCALTDLQRTNRVSPLKYWQIGLSVKFSRKASKMSVCSEISVNWLKSLLCGQNLLLDILSKGQAVYAHEAATDIQ